MVGHAREGTQPDGGGRQRDALARLLQSGGSKRRQEEPGGGGVEPRLLHNAVSPAAAASGGSKRGRFSIRASGIPSTPGSGGPVGSSGGGNTRQQLSRLLASRPVESRQPQGTCAALDTPAPAMGVSRLFARYIPLPATEPSLRDPAPALAVIFPPPRLDQDRAPPFPPPPQPPMKEI